MVFPSFQMNPFPRHFYFLDALRGLAALSVVFFHWPHFFYWGNDPSEFQLERLPFVSICRPLFLNGDRAVELFFCLSGFIFSPAICRENCDGRRLSVIFSCFVFRVFIRSIF